MKMGAEPKKIAILGGLLAVAAVTLYVNVFSSDEQPAARPALTPAARLLRLQPRRELVRLLRAHGRMGRFGEHRGRRQGASSGRRWEQLRAR